MKPPVEKASGCTLPTLTKPFLSLFICYLVEIHNTMDVDIQGIFRVLLASRGAGAFINGWTRPNPSTYHSLHELKAGMPVEAGVLTHVYPLDDHQARTVSELLSTQ